MKNPEDIIYGLFKDLERDVIDEILNRIEKVADIIPATDYSLWKINQYGFYKKQIKKLMKNALEKANKNIDDVYKKVLDQEFARNKALYTEEKINNVQIEDNPEVKQLIEEIREQTQGTFKNVTKTTGFIVREDGVTKSQRDTEYLKKTLDKALLEASTGTFSKTEAIKKATIELTNSGLRYFDYESGHKDRVDVAVRRAVMTGVNQLTDKVARINAQQLGTNMYEVSAHATARPEHMLWQGKVYSYEDLVEVCGLGTGPGLCGWNCYHHYDPFIEGVSVRKYTDEELQRMQDEAKKKTVYNNKEYTKYEATQEQRRLERELLSRRQRIEHMKKHGADKQDIKNEQARFHSILNQYKDFSEKMGLTFQVERTWTGRTYSALDHEKKNEQFEVKDITTEARETASPGIGTFTIEQGANPSKEEIDTGNWLVERLGGDVKYLKAPGIDNIKTADYEWNGKLWDLKTCSSLKSLRSAISEGKTQIKSNPGGIIINAQDLDDGDTKGVVERELVQNRMAMNVIIKKGENILAILENKKR